MNWKISEIEDFFQANVQANDPLENGYIVAFAFEQHMYEISILEVEPLVYLRMDVGEVVRARPLLELSIECVQIEKLHLAHCDEDTLVFRDVFNGGAEAICLSITRSKNGAFRVFARSKL